jgi:GTPase SAR1 family protein
MGYVIAAIVIIFLIYLLIRYVIAPISGFLAVASLVIGVGYALIISIYCFGKSLAKHINPYTTFVDKNTGIPSGVRRSYFFGPGFHQIGVTVKDAFAALKEQSEKLTNLREKHTSYRWYVNIWIWIFYIAAFIATFVFGFAWMSLFSTALVSVILIGMSIFYVMFTVLWGVDRFILAVKSIQSRCPNCKRISVVPAFICPDCGAEHRKLTPGPYGTFHRKCTCNNQLSTTFINGRSKLKAICPYCTTGLAASNARQYGIQLIGGTSAGKTTFLAAFWHIYLERLRKLHYLSYEEYPVDLFNELEDWYQKGLSSSTAEKNANMYSVIHKRHNGTPYQLTIYDIGGEAFSDLRSDKQQQQFKYCEGLIFVVDPTAAPKNVNDTFASFIYEFKGLKGKHSVKTSDIPVAVIISKADLYKVEIGLPKINVRYKSNPGEFSKADAQSSLDCTRNGVSKEFLVNHGYENVLNLLEGEYSNVQYFPVSAMGHPAVSGKSYEPWGVMEPVMWLLSYTDASFHEIITHLWEVSL